MSYIPVCCAAPIPVEVMEQFLTANHEYQSEMDSFLVFIDDTTKVHSEASKIGDWQRTSSALFKDKSPHECYLLLCQIQKNGSCINNWQFIVMDDRTLQDGSVLLVEDEGEEHGPAQTVRMAPEIVQQRIMLMQACYEEMGWFQEIAGEADDGVLRAEAIEDRPRP